MPNKPTRASSSNLNINLLPKDTLEVDSNSFLHWILTAGRYLVIFTEIIAVLTFALSIYLSKEKNDLRGKLNIAQAQVAFLQNCDSSLAGDFCENRFLKIQDQVNQITTIRTSQVQQNRIIEDLLKILPPTLTLKSLTITDTTLTFSGSFPSEQELQTLVDSFNKSTNITSLDITDLTKETTFEFTASAKINTAAFTGGIK